MKEIIIDGEKYQCFEESEVCNPFRIRDEYPKIISFRHKFGNREVFKLTDSGIFTNYKESFGYNYLLEDHLFEIYQVATSETEIFTVGDKVNFVHSGSGKYFTIDKFKYHNDNEIRFIFKEIGTMEFPLYTMNNLVHYKEPIFTTEDNIEVFEGDCVFVVDSRSYHYYGSMSAIETYSKSYKFSTKEAAESFIQQNKPRFSVKDVEDALEYTLENEGLGCCSPIHTAFKTLKQKLGI